MSASPTPKEAFDLPLLIFHLRNVSPFFGALALFADSRTTGEVETAATDGRRLFFNPSFMGSHTVAEQLGVLVHELLHAALRHVERRATADPHLWNIAADIVVNGMIRKTNGLVLPASALIDGELEEFPVEEVYEILLKRDGLPKRIRYLGGDLLRPSVDDAGTLRDHWNGALSQAAVVARMGGHGRLPAGIELAIAAVTDPPLDWRAMLWRYLTKTPVDFLTYDRRFIGDGLYLDAMDGETVRVAVCIDTSGSINSNELGRFLNEIRAILGAYPAITVDLHTCDTKLRGPWKLDTPECPVPKIHGGGGTSFVPFFEGMEHAAANPEVAVYLTDGYGDFPKQAPVFPILWVVTPGGLKSEAFPFGETARMLGE